MTMKKYNKPHVTAILIFSTVLCGCASKLPDRTLKPELIYTSGSPEPTQIILQQTQHVEVVSTIEGLRNSVASSDYKYSLTTAEGKTVALPFLDATNDSSGAGHIDFVFYNTASSNWIASSVVLSTHMEHVRGLFEWKSVDDLFVAVHVKTFTKDALVSKKTIEVCNISEAKNPVIQYDKLRPALRYCGKSGTTVYFPFTDTLTIENANNCCPGPAEQEHFGKRRSLNTFFEEAIITTSN
ncbi:hypothetical protein [Solimicrobium silvestre]|uniref:Lipoprotein n=1 Tax=Solimicrobium silvestre TaxID=2099400 RepID=A0A2S9H2W0_9BURK|nr:hypothetical protein [Solimicrobium silvestre]PRC94300.1 hypothetical protein S2091_0921 [Solimicrobium silvestre]